MSYFGFAGLLPGPVAAMVKPGIRSMSGDVQVNGTSVTPGYIVAPGDRVSTGLDGEATIVIGANAYLLRSEGEIIFPEQNLAEGVLTVVAGKILSVFGPGRLVIDTPLATIGIRGTGAYLEVLPDRNYVCLCYGRAVLTAKLDPAFGEVLNTVHHNAPRNFYATPTDHNGLFVEPATMINHKDEELILLESLVERIPLFGPVPIEMP